MSTDELVAMQDGLGEEWFIIWDVPGGCGVEIGCYPELPKWEDFRDKMLGEEVTLDEARLWWEVERLTNSDVQADVATRRRRYVGWRLQKDANRVLDKARELAEAYLGSRGRLPPWAQTALDEGWTAPEGWTP